MTSSFVKSHKIMRRTDSKKSHSWWWDSHVSPKNSKWLAENLEEMDQSVKRMLKLIEEDADSFSKKAEMYYQKRPELIAQVGDFYRMYRSLAERYDHVSGELRKTVPSDIQSQGSGISDVGSEPPSTWPSPDQRLSRGKSGPRAVGFEVFLGTGGSNSDLGNKEGDESSTLDSESESSDDSSINNYSTVSGSTDDQGARRKIIELEVELRTVKEKLRVQQEENSDGSVRGMDNDNSEILLARIAGYEEELRAAKENIRLSVEEIARLKIEIQKYEYSQFDNNLQAEVDKSQSDVKMSGVDLVSEEKQKQPTEIKEKIDGLVAEVSDSENKISTLEENLKVTKQKLRDSEKEVASLRHELESKGSSIKNLQDQLGLAKKELSTGKSKLDKDKREVLKLQDRIVRYKANLSDRDQEIRGLRETVSNANKSLSEENSLLQTEITGLLKERAYLEDNLKEWDLRCQTLAEDVRKLTVGISARDDRLGELNKSLCEFKLKHEMVMGERDELSVKVGTLVSEMSCKDDRIDQMNKHLHQLHIEHVELIGGIEGARKVIEELKSRVKELEREVERQQELILEGAEEKREVIRQLCFSLEHYRNGYHRLRQAFVGHRRLPVMAS